MDRLYLLLVTENFCVKGRMRGLLDDLALAGAVFGDTERRDWYEGAGIEEDADVVPAASHAETSFGLLFMWPHPEFEVGICLDDDTQPHGEFDFFRRHLDHPGSGKAVEHVLTDEQWVNVLYQNVDRYGSYPRGYPYFARDETVETEQRQAEETIATQGPWRSTSTSGKPSTKRPIRRTTTSRHARN